MADDLPTEPSEWDQYIGPNGRPRIMITPPSQPVEDDPYARAAERIRRSVKGRQQLPIEGQPAAPETSPSYLMAPDLLDTQQASQSLPTGVAVNDAGIPFNIQTGAEIPTVQRPNVLPIAKTPDGYTLAMPKMLDLASNVMGGVAGVPAKAGEVVLGSGAVRKMAEEAPTAAAPFFSALESAVDNAKLSKGSADQWLGYLKNQPGVKSEELSTVLGDLRGNLTKSEVQDAVKNNKVELGEVVKGTGEAERLATQQKYNKINERLEAIQDEFDSYERGAKPKFDTRKELEAERKSLVKKAGELQSELFNPTKGNPPTKYHGYQLPGGENYKEMLLTLPVNTEGLTKAQIASRIADLHEEKARLAADRLPSNRMRDEQKWHDLSKEQERLDNLRNGGFKSSHWDEPNIIAHIRHNDRMVEGKKTLHLEELQSDWHQKGRKEGYIQKDLPELKKKAEAVDNKLIAAKAEDIMADPNLSEGLKSAVDRKIIIQKEADDYLRLTNNENSTVPDAPFKKNWDELALKRMLHKAASEGYHGLSWTPGEAQAARYDLSKQIDSLHYDPKTQTIKGFKDNKPVVTQQAASDKLPDIVGKEAAKKLLETKPSTHKLYERYDTASEPTAVHSLEGTDLKIGGEGMKTFYDKMLVDRANSLVKKYGSKVELNKELNTEPAKQFYIGPRNENGTYDLRFKNKNGEERYLRVAKTKEEAEKEIKQLQETELQNRPKAHYLPITDELRAKAKQGFPLFSSTPILTPVNHDPFQRQYDHKSHAKWRDSK